VSGIVSSKVLVGVLYWRSSQLELALAELEPACPHVWNEAHIVRGIESDRQWIDCYSALGELLVVSGRVERAIAMEQSLARRMPWLEAALHLPQHQSLDVLISSQTQPLEVVQKLSALSMSERSSIAAAVRFVWEMAEQLRGPLNQLASDFVRADSKRLQLSVYMR